jgi:ATP-binding cassette subfamily B protein
VRGQIELEDVCFRYPGHAVDAIDGISLRIPAGSVVALVGENGTGKTTLVKLICGLYQPRSGRILLDGQPTDRIDPEQLRARFGVLFQDFVHYHLTARENIGFGDTRRIHDMRSIRAVAQRASIDEALVALPTGYETTLSRTFDEGHELSGGEWQRVCVRQCGMAHFDAQVWPTCQVRSEL